MTHPVVLFDGVCNLCNGAVRFILRWDRAGVFHFASLQSAAARELVGDVTLDSVVLVDEDGIHTRSEAAIRIARRLGWPWSMAVVAFVLPRAWRDAVYAWVARNRYRWFGRRESCLLPAAEVAGRFLDSGEKR